MKKKAVALVSGGIDSLTVMAMAINDGYDVYPVSFTYGQKHVAEVNKAKKAIENFKVKEHKIINIDLKQFGGSALTDDSIKVPTYDSADEIKDELPLTYVPARNTIFLSLALAYAEVIGAYDIFIGVHKQDHANYPDTRPEYIETFEKMANFALGCTLHEKKLKIHTPIIEMSKGEIVRQGLELGIDYANTISCYDATADSLSCGKCLACFIRKEAFAENNVMDPTLYR